MTCEHWKRCGDCHSPALVEGLRKVEDELRAEIATLRAEADEIDEEEHAIYQRVKKDADAAIRAAIGPCWNHLWGPGLEQLGHIIDAGMLRAERAEAEIARLTAILTKIGDGSMAEPGDEWKRFARKMQEAARSGLHKSDERKDDAG